MLVIGLTGGIACGKTTAARAYAEDHQGVFYILCSEDMHKNDFIREVAEGKKRPNRCAFHCIRTCDYRKSPYCIMLALYNAARGNLRNGYAFAGANAYMADKITTVRETISSLVSEFSRKAAELKNRG